MTNFQQQAIDIKSLFKNIIHYVLNQAQTTQMKLIHFIVLLQQLVLLSQRFREAVVDFTMHRKQ